MSRVAGVLCQGERDSETTSYRRGRRVHSGHGGLVPIIARGPPSCLLAPRVAPWRPAPRSERRHLLVLLPIEYHSLSSTDAWIFVVYVTSFPYLGWTFVPILALHGVLFGRVAYYLESRSRRLADAGAVVLFAVAAATTGVILQNPGTTAFVRSWSVGEGLLPAAALCGYVLIASGFTTHATQVFPRVPSQTPRPVLW